MDIDFPVVYGQLRALASSMLSGRGPAQTLQPTAVVHEAFVRLQATSGLSYSDREHFFAIAARAMRNVLVDHARAKRAGKRGEGWQRISLSGIAGDNIAEDFDAADVSEALDRLAVLSERQARIVELRFFAGLTVEDVARVIEVSERTVRNEWRVARAWLRAELSGEKPDAR
ncbi:MAG: ECF-type sigma factor [Planctomycetota bacterium]